MKEKFKSNEELKYLSTYSTNKTEDCNSKIQYLNELFLKMSMIDLNDLDRDLKEDILSYINDLYSFSYFYFIARGQMKHKTIAAESIYSQASKDLYLLFKDKDFKRFLSGELFLSVSRDFETVKEKYFNKNTQEYDFIMESFKEQNTPLSNSFIINNAFNCFEYFQKSL